MNQILSSKVMWTISAYQVNDKESLEITRQELPKSEARLKPSTNSAVTVETGLDTVDKADLQRTPSRRGLIVRPRLTTSMS